MIKIPGTIPIAITPTFWLLAALIGYLNSQSLPLTAIWIVIVVISVLIHEYGHALTALAFGQRARIELVSFGGVTHRHGPKLKLWKEFLVVLNGPLTGLLLCLVSYGLVKVVGVNHTLLSYTLQISTAVNLFWSIVNLLPVLPLDGGRLMSILFEGMFGVKGIKFAVIISVALAVIFGLGFFMIHAPLVGALFFFLAFESYRTLKSAWRMSDEDHDEKLQKLMKEAESDMRGGRNNDAITKFRVIEEQSHHRGLLYLHSAQLLAGLLSQQGRSAEAFDVLYAVRDDLEPPSLVLLHRTAYASGHWKETLEVGTQAYQEAPSHQVALLNAMACAQLGQVKPAIGWLQCAQRDGHPDLAVELAQPVFNSIRRDPAFEALGRSETG